MSGLEVVGVVLGAVPVFISAAEHYRESLNFVRRAVNRKQFVKQYKDELGLQRTLLCLYIKAVVGRTNLPPSTQAELVEKPNGDAWRNAEVAKELSCELGDVYQHFIGLLTKICTTLATQISSDDPADQAWTDDELLNKLQNLCLEASKKDSSDQRDIWGRIKFSWKHPERMKLLAELKSYNASLDKLVSAVNHAKPYERKQQARKAHATFKLRDDSERLYQVMHKACNCQPHKQRDFGLGLAVHHNRGATAEGVCFQLLLFDTNDQACAMSVKMGMSSEPAESAEPPKKKVRISFSKTQTTGDSMKKLQDICKEVRHAQKSNTGLQLMVDESGELYTIPGGVASKKADKDPVTSLCDVMASFQLYNHKRWLHREKAILAVILAYSLLQLHESSWWQSLWDSHSISFLGLSTANVSHSCSPDQRIRLRRPFTRSVVTELASAGKPAPLQRQKNAHLHALGVILLELYLNRSIKGEVDAEGGNNYRGVAQDLLEEHSDDINMTAEYLRAVQFCLSPHPNPKSGSFSFEDRGFREIFFSEVISMLEENLMSRFEVNDGIWTGGGD